MPVRIGTSGWHYPTGRGTWNGVFYPARRPRGFDELAYYAEHFDTVEVNSTFYRMPEPPMTRAWLRRTPDRFTFAMKLYQKFTHPDMYLAKAGAMTWDVSSADLDLFRLGIEPAAAAGRLAAVLIQFPPSFHAEASTWAYVEWLLSAFRAYPLAVELRHRSWREDRLATRARLAAQNAAWAWTDEPVVAGTADPAALFSSADDEGLMYVRLHGRNAAAWWTHEQAEDRYDYLYAPAEIAPFAERVTQAVAAKRKALVYFNNHFSAKAVANAAVLRHQLGELVPGDYPREMVRRYPDLAPIVATSGLPL